MLENLDIKSAAAIVGKNYSKKDEKAAIRELKEMFSESPIRPKYFVMEEKGKILGFAGYIQAWMNYDIYELFWVNVLPEMQREGIGQKLVGKIIFEIKKKKNARLILLTANVPNKKYYKVKFGFKPIQPFGKKYALMALSINEK